MNGASKAIMNFRLAIVLVTLAFASALPAAQSYDRPDLDAVYRIKEEAFQRSAIMELMGYLTDIHGPRLTNSPTSKRRQPGPRRR